MFRTGGAGPTEKTLCRVSRMSEQNRKQVSAIVPAYNEAPRIFPVLKTLLSYPGFQEVLVVDDGSSDGTREVASSLGARVVRLETNSGKGMALDHGVKVARGNIFFFCDADIAGLTHEMIDQIIEPVRAGKVELFIGMRYRRVYDARLILRFTPLLGGERALTRELWERVPGECKKGFRIETALNYYTRCDKGFEYKVFEGLSQTIKERKYGLVRGLAWRVIMGWEIVTTYFRVRISS